LQSFLDSGSAAGYYVSDAALPKITKGTANAPFAWMVIDPSNSLPAWEKSQLAAIAPVVNSVAELAALPNQPLTFANGLTGFGFYDQTGRFIVVISNPSTAVGATTITGNVSATGTGLSNGSHTWTNLITGETGSLYFSNGAATATLSVARWDTQVYAINP
jgi:hypothetical protein